MPYPIKAKVEFRQASARLVHQNMASEANVATLPFGKKGQYIKSPEVNELGITLLSKKPHIYRYHGWVGSCFSFTQLTSIWVM